MDSPTDNFCTDKIPARTHLYHHRRTNPDKNLLDNSIDTYVFSTEDNTDPMYESLFLGPSDNDSESYFYRTCDNSVESLTPQQSSEHSFQHSTRNDDDCLRQNSLSRSFYKILPIFHQKQENFSSDISHSQIKTRYKIMITTYRIKYRKLQIKDHCPAPTYRIIGIPIGIRY